MKKVIFAVVSILLFFESNSYSKEVDNEILFIRKHYSKINQNLKKYKKLEFLDIGLYKDINPARYSVEGSKLYNVAMINSYKYFDHNSIRKIVVTFNSQDDFQQSEYYVWNDQLFFVFKSRTTFLKPRWSNDLTEDDKAILENRYYISNNKLIRWLDPKKQEVTNEKKLAIEEKTLMQDFETYLTINNNDIGPLAK